MYIVVSHRGLGLDIPLAGALAVGPWAGVPDTLVRHDCGSYVNDERGVVFWRARALVVDWSIVVGIEDDGFPKAALFKNCVCALKLGTDGVWLVRCGSWF